MAHVPDDVMANRIRIAEVSDVRGSGIEIGALMSPMLAPFLQSKFIDRFEKSDLLRQYPELKPQEEKIISPDIICSGEDLFGIKENSYDYIIANHFMEHCEDFIGTLKRHYEVIKPGGRLFYAVPNKDNSFDKNRDLTNFEHLLRDHIQGPQTSRYDHYVDWVTNVTKVSEDNINRRALELMDFQYSIHFHVWSAKTFPKLLLDCLKFIDANIYMKRYEIYSAEMIVVLQKL